MCARCEDGCQIAQDEMEYELPMAGMAHDTVLFFSPTYDADSSGGGQLSGKGGFAAGSTASKLVVFAAPGRHGGSCSNTTTTGNLFPCFAKVTRSSEESHPILSFADKSPRGAPFSFENLRLPTPSTAASTPLTLQPPRPSSIPRPNCDSIGSFVQLQTREGDASATRQKNGRGRVTWEDGRVYEGDLVDGQFHGVGEFLWVDGRRYAGEYRDGRKHGTGVFSWPDGRRYEGDWRNGKRDGRGLYLDPRKKFERYALWENDEPVQWA